MRGLSDLPDMVKFPFTKQQDQKVTTGSGGKELVHLWDDFPFLPTRDKDLLKYGCFLRAICREGAQDLPSHDFLL